MHSLGVRQTFPQLTTHWTHEAAIVFYHVHCAAPALYCWLHRGYIRGEHCTEFTVTVGSYSDQIQASHLDEIKGKSVLRKDSHRRINGMSGILHRHVFFSFRVVFTVHQQQDPILTHHNGVCADSASDIKEPVNDCRENNTLLSGFVRG